jgi:multidrug efflux pump subunit AcrA (membrane-fusion protein)
MQYAKMSIIGFLIIMSLVLAGCSAPAAATEPKVAPAVVEKIEGTELNRLTLTEKAAQRLGIQTEVVREELVEGEQRLVVPYSAIIYDLEGGTWAYVSSDPLTFSRQPITVDHIEGDRAVLTDGPDAGTSVATVGVAELYGADTGIGK